jgi:hypothetical protein
VGSAAAKKKSDSSKEDKRQANDGTGTSAHGNTGRREDASFVRLASMAPLKGSILDPDPAISSQASFREKRGLVPRLRTREPGPRAARNRRKL